MHELSGLPESVRKLALDRFRLLQPHFEQNRPLRSVAYEAGIPDRVRRQNMLDNLRIEIGERVEP